MANYNSDYTGAQIDSAVSRANSTDVTAGTVAASKAVVVDSNKDITGFRHITATGTVTAANVSLTGNVDLGDASGDTVTITGSIDSNLIPATDDTYDIGSSSYAWQDIYLEGDIYLSDATEIDVASGNLTIDVAGDIEINADGGDITFKDASSTLAAIDSSGDFNVAGSIETATIDYTDGDLAITIADGGGVTFAQTSSQVSGSTIGNVTIANGSITDSSGAISFGNENLTTTGSSTAGSFVTGTLTVDDGSITDSDGSISFGDENLTTTGIISFGTLTDSGESIAVTKFVDEGDGISSNDNDTTIPTSAAVKDYVDTKVTAEDLDLTTDSGTIAIDLDSETLTLTGGTGVDTSASSNTVTFALDLNELATETTIADADFIAMVDATDDGSGKITFENLEDAIFASVSGDITITEGGVAAIQANSVALGTDTTGNYVATVADSGGGGITVANSGSESAAVTLELDIKGLTEDSIASGDFIAFSDEGESGDPANRETIDDVATLFAGTGLTASSAVIGVDASQTQITAVGTLATGAISSGFGAIDIGSSTANFGATTVDSLSASDGNITNVGDIALDSISADGTDINIAVSDNSATALTVKQGSDAYLIIDTANSSESVSIGTGISGTVLTLGHSTSETTVADNLSVDGNLTVSGNLLITGDSSEIKADDLVVDNATIAMGLTNGAAPSADSGFDLGIVPHWHTGSGAKTAFLGVDVSTSASAPKLTYIPDASFSSSIVSGTAGTIVANLEGNVTGTSGSTIGNLTLADGSITDSSGAISFGDENLSTTGTFSAEHLTSTDDATITDTISIDGTMTIATGSITDSSGAIDFGNENLSTSGTLSTGVVTATGFTIGSAVIAEAELEMIDGITAGTAAASKAVVLDGSKNIATLGTIGSGAITATGTSSFASLDISGDVDVDGTLETDALTINGTTLAETISDTVGAMVGSNTETGIAVTYEDGDNTLDFVLGATQTTLTSILNASLVAGRDADNQIKFSTDDQIIFRVAGGDGVTMKASGEIEATSLDISGASAIDGTATFAGVIRGANGSASAPEFSFTNNTDSGMYSPADNQLGLASGGSRAVEFGGDQSSTFYGNIQIAGTTPTLFIGDDGAEDAKLQILGNAIDFHIGIDDSEDKLTIGKGSTLGASGTPFITIDENGMVTLPDNYMTVLGRLGIGSALPAVELDVHGSAEMVAGFGKANDENAYVSVRTDNVQNRICGYSFNRKTSTPTGVGSTDTLAYIHSNVKNATGATSASGDLQFITNSGGNLGTRMTIDKDGKVGIGTTAPTAPLHIKAAPINTSGARSAQLYIEDTTAFGSTQNSGIQFRQEWQTGSVTSTSAIVGTRTSTSSGNYGGSLIFQTRANGGDLADNMTIEDDGTIQIPGTCSIQGITETKNIRARDNDSYDIGTSSKLYDDIYATNGTIQTSDARLKESVEDSKLGLDFLNKHRPVSYKQKGKTRRHYGLIAQEVEKVLVDSSIPTEDFAPLIKDNLKDDNDVETGENIYGMRYTEYVGILIKAVQELSAKVEALENA
mgnify:FL=1